MEARVLVEEGEGLGKSEGWREVVGALELFVAVEGLGGGLVDEVMEDLVCFEG